MEDLSVYREVFIEEMTDQLDRLEQDLLALEQRKSDALIGSLFRAAHTIKGSSAAMGFEEMKLLTHEIEHLLDKVRGEKLDIDVRLINALFQAVDLLKQLRDEYMSQITFSEISGVLAELRNFQLDETAPQQTLELSEWTEQQSHTASKSQSSDLKLLRIRIRLADDCPMKGPRFHLIARRIATEFGNILSSDPSIALDVQGGDELYADSLLLIGSYCPPEEIHRKLSEMTDVVSIHITELQSGPPSQPGADAGEPQAEEKQRHSGSQTIRVNAERLEQLMNLVGELLIDQTSLTELKLTLARRYPNEDDIERLADVSDRMSRIVGELQESVMKARMLPIDTLIDRFPRLVRDLSQKLGKEVELILDGTETELDRMLIEEIVDPLIHLIRNAVDHGVEPAKLRRNRGKSAAGRIRLNSYHEDNQVVITIEDDGEGIDPEQMKKAALGKGLITEEEAAELTDRESLELIFRPGFSTAAAVSEISGRGVGMDIVRNQIERFGGLIDIHTVPGQGTRFTVRLPLTLAIITGLMVKVSGRDFAIPMNNVLEIVRVPVHEIRHMHGEDAIVIRNRVVPLLWLHEALRYPKTGEQELPKFVPVVVVGSAEKKVAIAVDELLGNQEIVIKAIGSYLGKINCIAGATILGNGKVALILEISYLIDLLRKQK